MNTPAHAVLNALVLGRAGWSRHWFAITSGALLPDLTMVGFYFYQRLLLEQPERFIWSTAYFDPAWQAFFDTFHSLPLIGFAAFIAWRARSSAVLSFLASMALHSVCDLPLHNEDAHAHFFPLSSWRFRSPVSYWDPRHYGLAFAGAEMLLMLGGALIFMRRSASRGWRSVGAVALSFYLALTVFVLSVWAGPTAPP